MADRVVGVLAAPSATLPAELSRAMLEDVVDLVTETPLVTPVVLAVTGYAEQAREAAWPGTPLVEVPPGERIAQLLAAVPAAAAAAVAVVSGEVPDLPPLLLGKLFSAVAGDRGPQVAACPDTTGGLVAVAARLPVPGWLAGVAAGLDDHDALGALRAAAPVARLSVGPGWQRVRTRADVARLDDGLEGWEATRAALGR